MLKQGARIAVVAPAGRFDKKRLNRGVQILQEWEYTVVTGPNLEAAHRYFAGTTEQRASDLNWALTDPDIDAVWFARGGYGTVQVLEHVDWSGSMTGLWSASPVRPRSSPRWSRRACTPIHAPVIHSLSDHVDEASRRALRHWMWWKHQELPKSACAATRSRPRAKSWAATCASSPAWRGPSGRSALRIRSCSSRM